MNVIDRHQIDLVNENIPNAVNQPGFADNDVPNPILNTECVVSGVVENDVQVSISNGGNQIAANQTGLAQNPVEAGKLYFLTFAMKKYNYNYLPFHQNQAQMKLIWLLLMALSTAVVLNQRVDKKILCLLLLQPTVWTIQWFLLTNTLILMNRIHLKTM